MKEIEIGSNESNQRVDRFLKKYMSQASTGFIYKMLRKKRIKVNGAKVQPEYILQKGDHLQLYLKEETIGEFQKKENIIYSKGKIEVIYEDNNILLVNKPQNLLVHGDYKEKENTLINRVYYYLYKKGEFNPQEENTFTPACCNRLDRNTSGVVIVAKNYPTLQAINNMIRENKIEKKYITIVKGTIEGQRELKGYLIKDDRTNKVKIVEAQREKAKFIHTKYKGLKHNKGYSLLEINLITGRSHQIRAHLASEGFPIVGDRKYGIISVNREFYDKFGLDSQFLHAYSIGFGVCPEILKYLEGKTFEGELPEKLISIHNHLFY